MKTLRLALLIIGLAAVIVVAGCGQTTVARVNGTAITQEQFMQGLEQGVGLTEQFSAGRKVLDTLIGMQLIEKEAADKGVTVSDEEINKMLEDAQKNMQAMTGSSYEEFLKQTGATTEAVKKQMRFSLLLKKLVVTKSDMEEYFKVNAAQFDEQEQVKFYAMFLNSKEEAEAARKEVVDGKKDFAAVAKARMTGPGMPPAGVLNTAAKGRVGDAAMEKVIFSLQPGETSQVISFKIPAAVGDGAGQPPSRTVWQLFHVVSHEQAKKATFENSEAKIRDVVFDTKARTGEVGEYISNLKGKAKVEVLDPKYNALAEDYKKIAAEAPAFTPEPAPIGGQPPAPVVSPRSGRPMPPTR